MLAVDDSKSMLENGSGQLAFETLALVARSLSMLEAGDLCIVSFGGEEHIRVAHEFGKPFSSDAGMQVFQQFSYKQTGTNVRRLVADSIALFRDARAKQSSASRTGDLWQLQLIISDGICEDHDTIRRLVRQAQGERIMIVFIIVDAVTDESRSIMQLTQASFEPDESGAGGGGRWKMRRYLDDFPFPYYLIVRDVQELPAVLSLALKQWFAEVAEIS
jgi:midasin